MRYLPEFVRQLGVLRMLLVVSVLALIVVAPFADGPAQTTGWPLVRSVVAPTMFVIMAFVLPLDFAMTLLFMSDQQGAARRRLRNIAWVEAGLFIALMAAWAPLVVRLLSTLD